MDKDESELRWGKFYKLTEKTLNAIHKMDNMDKRVTESTGDLQKEALIYLSRLVQAFASWPSNIIYNTGVFMENHADELLSSVDPIKTLNKIFFINPSLSIKTKEEWHEFKEIIQDFKKKILKFHDDNVPMTQYFSLISVPIPDIHPIKEKRHNSIQ